MFGCCCITLKHPQAEHPAITRQVLLRNRRKNKKEEKKRRKGKKKQAVISNIEKWWFGQVAVIQKREITLMPRNSWSGCCESSWNFCRSL